MIEYRNLRVALLGAGSVGAQVASLLLEHGEELANRVGAGLELVGVAVRDLDARPHADIAARPADHRRRVAHPRRRHRDRADRRPRAGARRTSLLALNSGADVITANKALLATHGPELFDDRPSRWARSSTTRPPSAAPSRSSARCATASRATGCTRILGIVNGTTNYILDRMDREGDSFDEALAAATELGYAEADPTADVEGYDAAQKATILASLAFHTTVPLESVYREGITVDHARAGCRGPRGRLRRQAARRLRAA